MQQGRYLALKSRCSACKTSNCRPEPAQSCSHKDPELQLGTPGTGMASGGTRKPVPKGRSQAGQDLFLQSGGKHHTEG